VLHTLLTLERPLLVFDLETTSLDVNVARIVEIGFQVWTAEGLKKEWRSLVNPSIPIPPESTKTHHITDLMMKQCRKCGMELDTHPIGKTGETTVANCIDPSPVPTFNQLAPNLATGFANCDYAGKNVRYDLQVMAAEMKRAGVIWDYMQTKIIDVDRLEQLGEPRTLSHLYKKHLGHDMVDAHSALADVRATTELIEAQLKKYQALPRSLDLLHEAQWPGYVDSSGSFRFVNGVATCNFGKHRGKPMKNIPTSYYDWLISADFSDEIKTLAGQAKLGSFPVQK
jgi:DNA polymerase-3 subunit epsilon